MKLLFKQRVFSWFDSYDIYDEAGNTVYTVKGQLAWGHKLVIYDAQGNELGMVVQKMMTILPKFELYKGGQLLGCMTKELSFFVPHYSLDYNGWKITGNVMAWDYQVLDANETLIATAQKQVPKLIDTYVIDVADEKNALDVLMFVLAIDAEKDSR